jgi:hypothetical protein
LQIDKWAALQEYANYFVQRLNKVKQSILPNYLFIPEAPSITFDSFTGLQRMITVQLSFTLVVPTNCEPVVTKLVECIANIVTSSNLTAALKNIFELASTLQASSSLSANLQLTKFASSSLTGAGTLASDLTVTGSATLLLDLYPNAAAAYSLRKLRTAYAGSAIRVRRSSDNTEQDIGFVSGNLDESALTTFCGAGNGFVTTWYNQSGNAGNATQSTAVNQPKIVDSGIILKDLSNYPAIRFISSNFTKLISNNAIIPTSSNFAIISVTDTLTITTPAYTMNSVGAMRMIIYPCLFNNNATRFNFRGTEGELSGGSFDVTSATNRRVLNIGSRSGNLFGIIRNNFSNTINKAITNTCDSFNIGNIDGSYNGNFNELIVYHSDQTTNFTGIQNNINTHYAIY